MTSPLRQILDKGPRGGVFFLHGEDEYRKEEVIRELIEAHLDPATRDFNLDRVRGSDVSVEDLARIVATPPMMAEWRVVVVREAEVFAGSPKARDLVLDLAESPPADLALILAARIPERSKAKFYSELKKTAQAVEFKALTQDDVPGWLMEQAKLRFAVPLDVEAARALAQGIGTDLGILSQELEKLAGVAGEDSRITLEHVRAAGTILPRQDRWQWFDLVGNRRFEEAATGLHILLAQGETGVGLTIGLTTHLLRLGLTVERGPDALERTLPPPQKWLSQSIAKQARGWTSQAIRDAVLGLLRVDRLLKASSLSDEHHLEEWLLTLMSSGDAAA